MSLQCIFQLYPLGVWYRACEGSAMTCVYIPMPLWLLVTFVLVYLFVLGLLIFLERF